MCVEMAVATSMHLSRDWVVRNNRGLSSHHKRILRQGHSHYTTLSNSSYASDVWSLHLLQKRLNAMSYASSGCKNFLCRSSLNPSGVSGFPILKSTALVVTRLSNSVKGSPFALRLIPAVGIIAFSVWGLSPILRLIRTVFFRKNDNSWKKSSTHFILSSYIQPVLLWTGITLICRAFDPLVLSSEASQAVKKRLLTFVQSLSTVLAFAYCLSSLIQQSQKFFLEANEYTDAGNMGFQFAGKAIYTAVWVAALSLFMELLGFSTQKWLTAGGLGTVLLTLAGREIFTNFLSSIMIHTTRPFVLNEWIQTRIDGSEVSGTVEHVGWWSPTIIRGDDREAIHIPNHKFTVNIVRNLTQKSHWRIKTHLAISHLDVNKINIIVADMRKVLSKHPQVEQQKLHRRVFLENINPENQALMILISCFVKTSHFEEYLRVKETVLSDLLRIVSHHRARLATPIRTIQKVYGEADLDIPFSETIVSSPRPAASWPFLLIEPSYKINNDDKTKASSKPTLNEKDVNVEAGSTPNAKTEPSIPRSAPHTDSKIDDKSAGNSVSAASNGKATLTPNPFTKNPNSESDVTALSEKNNQKSAAEDTLMKGSKAEDELQSKLGTKMTDTKSVHSPTQQDTVKPVASAPPTTRAPLEENLVLGVALDGSRRTLPLDEEVAPPTAPHEEVMEMAASRNAVGSPASKDKDNGHPPAGPKTFTE